MDEGRLLHAMLSTELRRCLMRNATPGIWNVVAVKEKTHTHPWPWQLPKKYIDFCSPLEKKICRIWGYGGKSPSTQQHAGACHSASECPEGDREMANSGACFCLTTLLGVCCEVCWWRGIKSTWEASRLHAAWSFMLRLLWVFMLTLFLFILENRFSSPLNFVPVELSHLSIAVLCVSFYSERSVRMGNRSPGTSCNSKSLCMTEENHGIVKKAWKLN